MLVDVCVFAAVKVSVTVFVFNGVPVEVGVEVLVCVSVLVCVFKPVGVLVGLFVCVSVWVEVEVDGTAAVDVLVAVFGVIDAVTGTDKLRVQLTTTATKSSDKIPTVALIRFAFFTSSSRLDQLLRLNTLRSLPAQRLESIETWRYRL